MFMARALASASSALRQERNVSDHVFGFGERFRSSRREGPNRFSHFL